MAHYTLGATLDLNLDINAPVVVILAGRIFNLCIEVPS